MKGKNLLFAILIIVSICSMSIAVCAETLAPGSTAVYFVDNISGNNTNEGTSADAPLKTLAKAYEYLAKTKGGAIVICGKVEIASAYTPIDLGGAVIYTSVWGSTDYRSTNGAKLSVGANMAFSSDTYFKNINLSITESELFFSGRCNNFGFLEGVSIANASGASTFKYPSILGGWNAPTSLNDTSNAANYSVHVYSGTWESVCAGNRRTSADHAVSSLRGDISLIIKGGTFGGVVYGTGMNVHTGRMYIEISGGTFKDRVIPIRRIGSFDKNTDRSVLDFTANVLVRIKGGTFKSEFRLAESTVSTTGVTYPPKGDATVVITGGKFTGKVLGYGVIGSVLLKYDDTVIAASKLDGWPAVKTGSQARSTSPTEKARFTNPIEGKPDPYITEKDGIYYYCFSSGETINGTVYAAIKVAAHGSVPFGHLPAQCRSVFNATDTSVSNAKHNYWAPELHYFDAATVGSANAGWYIYFAADNGNSSNHRMYVLRATEPENPLSDYKFVGQISDSTNRWAIDGTVLVHNGIPYFVWSGWPNNSNGCQNIYIAKMSNPWTISSERVLLSTPEYSWETHGSPDVNEGPQVLKAPDGTVHIVYSASGSWDRYYCYGVLTLTGSNPLNASHWYKATSAKFSSGNGVYGTGHGSFVKDSVGDWWMIYHANPSLNVPSGSSWWAERRTYAKQFSFTTMTLNGVSVKYPSFGTPAADGGTQYVQVRTADYHASGDHLYSPVMKSVSGTAESLVKTCYICGATTTLHKVDVPTAKASVNNLGYVSLAITPKVTGASGYIVYRTTSSTGVYKEIDRTSSTTYVDKDTVAGQVYYYKVKQYKSNAYGSHSTYGLLASDASAATSVTATLHAVEFSSYYDNTGILLSWDAVDGAEKYRIFRRKAGAAEWDTVSRYTAETSYKDTSAISGIAYEYAVQAWVLKGSSYMYSPLYVETIMAKTLGSPTLTVKNVTTGVSITVSKVSSAEGYKIYRSTDGKKFTQIARITETTYTDTTAKADATYYYNARAFTQASGISYSPVGDSVTIVHLAPITPTVYCDGDAVRLTWPASAKAEKYRIFRREESASAWESDVIFSETASYTDTTAKIGTAYEYAVQAWALNGSAYCYSPLEVVTITPQNLGTPTLTVKNTVEGVSLSTTAVADAEGYKFYRSTDGITFEQIAKTAETSYVDTTANVGTTYYYRVRAYIIGDGISYSPVGDSSAIVRIYPVDYSVYYDGTGIYLTWSTVENADKYRIFRREAGASAWDGVSRMTKETSYTDTTAKSGVKYEYAVQAWVMADGAYCYSPLEVQTISFTQLATPTVTAKITDAGISVTTTAVSGAEGYKFYRSTDGKKFEQIAKTTATSFVDENVELNTAYYYQVRAYKIGTGVSYSAMSAAASVIKLEPIIPDLEYMDGTVTVSWLPSKTAAKYRVFRRVAGESAWDGVSRMTLETEYTDTTVVAGTTYEYAVQDWTLLEGTHRYSSLVVYTISASALSTPTLTAAISSDGIYLTNTQITDATGYRYYRSEDGITYKNVADIASPSYLDTTVEIGTQYYYKSVAYTRNENVTNCSDYSAVCAAKITPPDAPTLSASASDGGILLTASTVSNATGYRFYRSNDGVSFEELVSSAANTYTDTTAVVGTRYYYKVCAYLESSIATAYSADSNTVSIIEFAYKKVTSGEAYDAIATRANGVAFTMLERKHNNGTDVALEEIPKGTYVYSVYGNFIIQNVLIDSETLFATVPYENADAIVFADTPLVNYGDVDANGTISILDVLKTLKHSVGMTTALDIAAANTNGDLEISIVDALGILEATLN